MCKRIKTTIRNYQVISQTSFEGKLFKQQTKWRRQKGHKFVTKRIIFLTENIFYTLHVNKRKSAKTRAEFAGKEFV
jgi:hypothetical protein